MNKSISPVWLIVGGLLVVIGVSMVPGEHGFGLAMISTLGGLFFIIGIITLIVKLAKPKEKKQ